MTSDSAPIFLDCDTGIDDSLTIAYLIAAQANVVGIGTVCGNIGSEEGARNTLNLLELLGAPEIPVAVGERDFSTETFHGGAPEVHGHNGVGDVVLPESARQPIDAAAPQLLSQLARQYPGELRVLAIGPLTNIAAALTKDPELASLVKDVTIMGGAAAAPGNMTPVGEANIANDPEAAAIVIEADWDITLVPLDVTMEHRITAAHAERLRWGHSPALTALAGMLEYYFDFYIDRFRERAAALHDPLAAAVLLGDVKLAVAPRVPVVVDDSHGPGRGQTIVDLRGLYAGFPNQNPADVRVPLLINDKFGDFLTETLLHAFTTEPSA